MMKVLLLLLVSALAHDFKLCGADHIGIKTVDITPEPVVPGKTITVKISGVPDRAIASGKAEVVVTVLGLKIATLDLDICKDLNVTCPVKSGASFVGLINYAIPAQAPAGVTANVNIKVTDSTGAELSCVDLSIKIAKGASGYEFLFSNFMRNYGKSYEFSEMMYRLAVFSRNFRKIHEHSLGGHSWTQSVNEFCDLTWEEFRASRVGYKPLKKSLESAAPVVVKTLANEIDWRNKGVVTPVKDQGQCGSCWAFSATGSIEGAYAQATGSLVSFSEQYLVDCSGSAGNQGCNGGWMDSAFDYVIKNGICKEGDYPYKAKDQSCDTSCQKIKPITQYVDIRKDEGSLMEAVNVKPVSIAIEADQQAFQFYKSGVMDGKCDKNLDHGVLVVGYGTESKDYWLVKNSWGAGWGEQGYIKLVRGIDQCGLTQAASYPL